MTVALFCNVASCGVENIYRHFGLSSVKMYRTTQHHIPEDSKLYKRILKGSDDGV
jgi:hypothetical protein